MTSMGRRTPPSSASLSSTTSAAAAKLYIVMTLLSFVHINKGQTYDTADQRFPVLYGWPHVHSYRTPLDLSRFNGAGDFSDVPARHKRSMSWLLAAVMSVCEEDPRKCRVTGRGRQRLRGGGGDGEYINVDTNADAFSTPILEHVKVLKRSADDSGALEIIPVFRDRLTQGRF